MSEVFLFKFFFILAEGCVYVCVWGRGRGEMAHLQ